MVPRTVSAAHRAAVAAPSGDDDRERDQPRVEGDVPVQPHRRHAQVVHGGHADTGAHAAEQQRAQSGGTVADGEDAWLPTTTMAISRLRTVSGTS